jgi:hypothetical protein
MKLNSLRIFGHVIIFSLIVPCSVYASHPDNCWLQVSDGTGDLVGAVKRPAGNTIFRIHLSADQLNEVFESHSLEAKTLPHTQTEAPLTGIHFILPSVLPKGVLDKHSAYIDFQLAPDTIVTQLSDGSYLISGPSATPDWLTEAYDQFKGQIQNAPPYMQTDLRRLESLGGPKNPLKVSITIVGFHKP